MLIELQHYVPGMIEQIATRNIVFAKNGRGTGDDLKLLGEGLDR
jgi:hypothetical protein